MFKAKDMTIQEYADMRKVTSGAVRKAIMKGHKLPGVLGRTMWGKSHVLRVSAKMQQDCKNTLKKVA